MNSSKRSAHKVKATGSSKGATGIAIDAKGNVWVVHSSDYRVEEFNEKGEYVTQFGSYGYPSGHGAFLDAVGIGVEPNGNIWVSEDGSVSEGNKGVQVFNEKHEWLNEFGSAGVGAKGELSWGALTITTGKSGAMWVAANNLSEFKENGEFLTDLWAATLEAHGAAMDSKGDLWISNGHNNIEKWIPGKGTEGESRPPASGSTVEYNVPLEGEGMPAQMGVNPTTHKPEPEKWAQKDDPVYATAIFAPDEPQGWPASDYKRATAYYMDSEARTVNVAAPSGGVSTSEYNEMNDVTRTLSADNRAAAINESCKSVKTECKSAEIAEKLDTKTEYNASGSDIVKVLGPEHKVKLLTGEEVEARAVTHNYYDEGATGAEEKNKETYNLVTKTTSGALLANGEEKDVRTETTSYSGQEGLGWKLRKPTSTTVEPAGLDLVNKMVYDESTGAVVEARAPAGNSEQVFPPSFSFHFGGSGSGNGQFKEPWAVALDASENAVDTGYW